MYIKSLECKNFRNYDSLCATFDPGTNVFYGDNAQGKTNILEGMYLCGTTKSHRGNKDKEMIRFGEEEAHIRMVLHRKNADHKIDMHLRQNKTKGVAIDGLPIRKASELFGIVNFVFFSPEDLNIIKNGPAERRKFVDSEMCQLNKLYMSELSSYNKVLAQRNKLLKDMAFSPALAATLSVWDEQLISYGKNLIRQREVFIRQLNTISGEIHSQLTGGKEEIQILYEPDTSADSFEENLAANREKDLRYKMSSVGPHRDDICVLVNGIDIRKYGSQGQQRSAALSLKLSEIRMIRTIVKTTPVLLLDDVLSELDSNRQRYLLNSIKDIQTFITCTGMDDLLENDFPIDRIFRVVNGTICSEASGMDSDREKQNE
ncbi:MAG: DNA replication/repair protein RecF [Lachnospiraceae bacterium]|nr:DNA replication/repair protein RecF [Lachnospiraceae bacterium]